MEGSKNDRALLNKGRSGMRLDQDAVSLMLPSFVLVEPCPSTGVSRKK